MAYCLNGVDILCVKKEMLAFRRRVALEGLQRRASLLAIVLLSWSCGASGDAVYADTVNSEEIVPQIEEVPESSTEGAETEIHQLEDISAEHVRPRQMLKTKSENPSFPAGFKPIKIMRKVSSSERRARTSSAPAGAKLTYYGGPVISNIKVKMVLWGTASSVSYSANLVKFYQGLVDSVYMDWLSEYNTPRQKIGRGSVITPWLEDTDGARPQSKIIMDSQIQAELRRLLAAGKLPSTDLGNSYFPIHFPPGYTIQDDADNSKSCVDFCAYHGTTTYNGKYVYYGVIPDLGSSSCTDGCGTGTAWENTQVSASHEMIEAVTDPAVGLADDAHPTLLGWYDNQPNHGEISDLCNDVAGQVATKTGTWTVSGQFSNTLQNCVIYRSSGQAPKPTPTTAANTGTTSTTLAATVLALNEWLGPDYYISSPDGASCFLYVESYGDVYLYPGTVDNYSDAVWSSEPLTVNRPETARFAWLQPSDGRFVMYDGTSPQTRKNAAVVLTNVKAAAKGVVRRLALFNNGNLALYEGNKVIWQSGTRVSKKQPTTALGKKKVGGKKKAGKIVRLPVP